MFLIFIGGIGFPVLLEIHEWLHFKKRTFVRRNEACLSASHCLVKLLLAFIVLFIGGLF